MMKEDDDDEDDGEFLTLRAKTSSEKVGNMIIMMLTTIAVN